MGKIISIIGPPAIGKTTICSIISKEKKLKLIKESTEVPNEIVQNIKNYKNFLLVELWYYNQMIKNIFKADGLRQKGETVIMDTYYNILPVWGKVVLQELEQQTFLELLDNSFSYLPVPDLVIGLTCSKEQLYNFYKKRNAEFDKGKNSFDRIIAIKNEYEKLYEKEKNKIKVVDTTGLDFYNFKDIAKFYEESSISFY